MTATDVEIMICRRRWRLTGLEGAAKTHELAHCNCRFGRNLLSDRDIHGNAEMLHFGLHASVETSRADPVRGAHAELLGGIVLHAHPLIALGVNVLAVRTDGH